MKKCVVLKWLLLMSFILLAFLVSMPCSVLGADVEVYAEGAYTNTDMVLYIYADIEDGPILSFGVKVLYPASLTYTGATKNESVWYFGNGSADYSYMDPEKDGSGIVIIGGKLNTSNPTEGVQGERVLLGTVSFTHSGVSDFSGVSVSYGRGDGTGDYKNFVDVNGGIVDGTVAFSTKIRERGDANADGSITSADLFAVRSKIGSNYDVWSDCNADNSISSADLFCVRNKM